MMNCSNDLDLPIIATNAYLIEEKLKISIEATQDRTSVLIDVSSTLHSLKQIPFNVVINSSESLYSAFTEFSLKGAAPAHLTILRCSHHYESDFTTDPGIRGNPIRYAYEVSDSPNTCYNQPGIIKIRCMKQTNRWVVPIWFCCSNSCIPHEKYLMVRVVMDNADTSTGQGISIHDNYGQLQDAVLQKVHDLIFDPSWHLDRIEGIVIQSNYPLMYEYIVRKLLEVLGPNLTYNLSEKP